MFDKKFKIFLIALACMLSVSAVSAADVNVTDDLLAGDVNEEPPSDNAGVLSASEDTLITDFDANYVLDNKNTGSYYSESDNVFLSQNNNPVENVSGNIKVNGISYNLTTDIGGKASISLDLDAGTHVISTSVGNTLKEDSIDVLPVVIGSDITKTYSNTKKYTATFLNSDGSPLKNTNVKFILNGKTYTKKTDSKGVASLEINLKVGTYTVSAVHPNGYTISNKIVIKTSVITSDLSKHYRSSKVFSATFYNKNGKVLANRYVTFKAHGSTFKVKTNSKGVAKISIVSTPGTFKISSVNPVTGETKTNTVKVLKTMSASQMRVFSDITSTFKVKLYKNDKLVKNAKVYVYIKGVKNVAKTNSNGVASVNFKLAKGIYTFKSYDPYTKSSINTKITVVAHTIPSSR